MTRDKREDTIIKNLHAGRTYRKELTTTGESHETITYDPISKKYYQTTHYERYNPADDGPMILEDVDEAVWRIQSLHFRLVPDPYTD